MRGSTSASTGTSRTTRSRSARSSWPEARWPRWPSSTPWPAACPARSATSRAWTASRSRRPSAGGRNTRTTRARPATAVGACPRSCSRGTTPRSSAGGRPTSGGRRADAMLPVVFSSRGAPAMSVIETLERQQLRDDIPEFKAGDTVRVHFRVIEGTRQRVQVFEGIVIKRQGSMARETFTVRKQSFGVGVERTFPLHSPKIERIERTMEGDVHRAKLYYLRGKVGKKARVREKQR